MAAEQNGVASGSANASERTPLLGDSAKRDDVPQAEADENARPSETEDGTPLAEEVSTKKLMVIMGATFTGLFFAALGIPRSRQDSSCTVSLTNMKMEQSSQHLPVQYHLHSTRSLYSDGSPVLIF